MENGYGKARKWIDDADGMIISASNGLSISEGLDIFADDDAFEELFGDFLLVHAYFLAFLAGFFTALGWGFWGKEAWRANTSSASFTTGSSWLRYILSASSSRML